MKVVNAAEMAVIEKTASSQFHILPIILMENAGKEAASFIKNNIFTDINNKRAAIFAGKGNNAGDGFVVARHLFNMGVQVRVFLLNKPEEFSQDAMQNFKILQNMNVRIQTLVSDKDVQTLKIALLYTDIIVDGVFGTGFKGAPPPFIGKIFNVINNSGLPVVALDIPSGVEADTGRVYSEAIKATWTLAMGLPKIGLVINAGSEHAGEVITLDISLPKNLLNASNITNNLITDNLCQCLLPQRRKDSHKGTYGHLLVIGGSSGMMGASILAAQAASRSGCGLITLAVPESLEYTLSTAIPYVMTKGLQQTDKLSFSADAYKDIEPVFGRMQSLVIGPGLSRHPETMEFVRKIFSQVKIPVVLDADAFFAFKGKLDILKNCNAPIVMTPHPGEMAMLLDKSIEEVQKSRIETAQSFAAEYGVTVVLKGYRTIISSPLGENYIAITGNAGMAKGGTGDALAGIIGGLLAQGISPIHSSIIGVHVHGKSGDIYAEKHGMQGMNALDLVENLPEAWKVIE